MFQRPYMLVLRAAAQLVRLLIQPWLLLMSLSPQTVSRHKYISRYTNQLHGPESSYSHVIIFQLIKNLCCIKPDLWLWLLYVISFKCKYSPKHFILRHIQFFVPKTNFYINHNFNNYFWDNCGMRYWNYQKWGLFLLQVDGTDGSWRRGVDEWPWELCRSGRRYGVP
jgi:hypothetical protein